MKTDLEVVAVQEEVSRQAKRAPDSTELERRDRNLKLLEAKKKEACKVKIYPSPKPKSKPKYTKGADMANLLTSDLTDEQRRVIELIQKFAGMGPEDDEEWDSWYLASFEMLSNEVGEYFERINQNKQKVKHNQ